MRKAYLYPVSSNAGQVILSIYIENFMNYLSGDFQFLNRTKPSNKGILDIFSYVRDIKFIFLNWIEDLPDKRGGFLQSFFFILLVHFLKIKKVRIIWTMHNKESHYPSNAWLKRILFNFILRKSDYIITHSKEGINCFNQYKVKDKGKIRYFPHPLNNDFIPLKSNPSMDILIWGSIIPYKGIDKFLSYLYENNLQDKYNIYIAGKVKPDDYELVIKRFCNSNIHLDNRYVPEEDLKKIMADSRTVIFTYIATSVLSSGALMDTLSYGMNILAPHAGAFKDAQEDGLINTYNNYNELIVLLDKALSSQSQKNHSIIERFIKAHDWQTFSLNISNWIK